MRKLLISLSLLPIISFAADLDMSNLKCGDLQIYSNTTLQEVQDNCLLDRQFKTNSDNKYSNTYLVEFYSTSVQGKVRCDFTSDAPNALISGCR